MWQLTSFADGTLEKPLALIEDKVQTVSSYVNKWLQFQSLWDLEAEYVYNRLGDSLADWGQLLSDIRQTRSTFDTADTKKDFGVCVIDYANAQSKVNAKYDSWQRELLARYGAKLGVSMKDTYNAILKARTELEGLAIEEALQLGPFRSSLLYRTLRGRYKSGVPKLKSSIEDRRLLRGRDTRSLPIGCISTRFRANGVLSQRFSKGKMTQSRSRLPVYN